MKRSGVPGGIPFPKLAILIGKAGETRLKQRYQVLGEINEDSNLGEGRDKRLGWKVRSQSFKVGKQTNPTSL